MPAYTVLRIAKLKSWGAIGGAGEHNSRKRETPNADPERLKANRFVVGEPGLDLAQAVRERIGEQTIRKNAVLAVEGILSASPEYFRPGRVHEPGVYDPMRLEDWAEVSRQWLERKYGDRVVSAVLHLDEATPHIQFVLVPLNDTGKLNCRALFGGTRRTLSELQTDYANAVAPLGIQRGLEGSRAKHQEVSKFYALTQGENAPELPKLTGVDLPEMPGKLVRISDSKLQDYAIATAETAAKAQREMAVPVVQALAKENAMLKKQSEELRQANSALSKERDELRRQADKMRGIDPCEVLKRMYGGQEAPDSKPNYKSRKFILPDGMNIGVTDSLWVDNSTGKGSKGPINLVMYLSDYKQDEFKLAVRDLAEVFGEGEASSSLAEDFVRFAPQRAAKITEAAVHEPFRMPEAVEHTWERARHYLCEVRKIPARIVDGAHEQGLVFSDNRSNCVFARDKGSGVFKRGTGEQPFKQTLGQGGLPFVLPGTDNKVYVTEGPIDALSLKLWLPESTILATGGNMPVERLKTYLDGKEVKLAHDKDAAGDEQARRIWQQYPEARRATPDEGKDWNERLRLRLERKATTRKAELPEPVRGRSRGRGRGM
ncbi:MAG: hypothetical protein CVU73_08035 [Deltaproteobacteria bacterium HGW-Deltaproteobacteria-8]|jgi:5S rRNA maturation endonuclease (ribonuclease M5)|nr:MAG: hypothetical protein CVU73_08035 [Deltaproteobacteria bacterium HGW-Deltaproteobacteria-8]